MPRVAPESGVRYTPDALALEVARRALAGARGRVRVLDPACGDGALLVAAWRFAREHGACELRPEDVFGIELDAARAAAARERLAREIGAAAADNVRVSDALDARTQWPTNTRVVANPPWVSFSGRHAVDAPQFASARAFLVGRDGWPSAHGAFLERIAEHVAAERTAAALLLPASVAALASYAPLRRRVTARARVASPPLAIDENAFEGVTEPAIVLALAPRVERGGPRSSGASAAPPEASSRAWPVASSEHDAAEELVRRLDDFPRLPATCFGDPGVHTGNAARRLILARSDAARELPPIREGRDLDAFVLRPARKVLDVAVERSSDTRFRYASLERYRSVPVLVRQTANRPIAALHTSPTYFRNTLLACTPPPGLDPALVVAALNSEVVARWHRARQLDARQRAFPQVKVAHLRDVPFPFLTDAHAPRGASAWKARIRDLARAGDEIADSERAELDAWVTSAFGLEP